MIKVAKEWNPKQSRLREIIFNPEKFDEAIKLCLEMHKKVHSSEMSKCSFTTYEDRLWNGLNEELFNELKNYRIETGRRTQKIISGLKPPDLKREMTERQLKRLYDEGCVLDVEGSSWLADFWGRKKVAGILLMPITRRQVVHLNKSLKIKEKYS